MKSIGRNINIATIFSLVLVLMGLTAEKAIAQGPGGVQETKTVKRADLTSTAGTFEVGKVIWGFWIKGKAGAGCTLTSDGTNTNEIMMRVTDNGGLSGDPICELSLRFESLKNHYTFDGVTIDTFPGGCGNSPCEAMVLKLGSRGSNSLDVTVRGKMKGTLVPNVHSIFRVSPTLRGPAGFNPFLEQAKPDLVVAKIDKTNLSSPGNSSVVVTLANLGDADWIDLQSFAYATDPSRAVLVSLRKDNVVCGSAPLTLNQFDPDRGLNRVNQPVTLTWPGCSFSGTANFTATVDVGNRLFEREETTGKSKTVELRTSIVTRPR